MFGISLVRRVESSPFVRSASTLVLFTVLGQAINVAMAPVLSRLYSPEDFGAFGILLTFMQAVSVACCLNYDTAIPAASTQDEATKLLLGNFVVSLAMSLLLTAVFGVLVSTGIGGYGVLPLWSTAFLWGWLWFSAATSAFHYFSMGRSEFRLMGEAVLQTSVARVAVQLLAGMVGLSWIGLAGGEVAGRVSGALRYVARHGRLVRLQFRTYSLRSIGEALGRHRQFPLVLLPPTLIDQILSTLYMPVITALFGLQAAGQYFFMRRLVDLPMALVAKTVADAFHGRIAAEVQVAPGRVRPLLLRVFGVIVIPAAIAAIPIMLAGPTLFAFVFGEPWRQAGLFAAYSVPAAVVNLGVSPVSRVFAFTSRPALRSVFTAANSVGTLAVFIASWTGLIGLEGTAAALGAVSLLAYSAYFVAAYVAAGHLVSAVPHA